MNEPEILRARFGTWWNEDRFDQIQQHFYAPDALLVPAAEAPIRGSAEITAYLQQMRVSLGALELPNIESGVDGALGYVIGRFAFPDAASPMHGTTAEIYRRQADGSWRCTVDMFQPMAAT